MHFRSTYISTLWNTPIHIIKKLRLKHFIIHATAMRKAIAGIFYACSLNGSGCIMAGIVNWCKWWECVFSPTISIVKIAHHCNKLHSLQGLLIQKGGLKMGGILYVMRRSGCPMNINFTMCENPKKSGQKTFHIGFSLQNNLFIFSHRR